MIRAGAFRGQPLLLLGGLTAGWIGLRVVLWAPPFAEITPVPASLAAAVLDRLAPAPARGIARREASTGRRLRTELRSATLSRATPTLPSPWPGVSALPALQPLPLPAPAVAPTLAPAPVAPRVLVPVRVEVGHNLLLMAALSAIDFPAEVLAYVQPGARPAAPQPAPSLARAPRTCFHGRPTAGC